jgi:hypothetical protein
VADGIRIALRPAAAYGLANWLATANWPLGKMTLAHDGAGNQLLEAATFRSAQTGHSANHDVSSQGPPLKAPKNHTSPELRIP